jgi:hypothetical protein
MGVSGTLAVLAATQIALVQAPGAASGASQLAEAPSRLTGTPWTLRIGPQRPDLVRYNRVEALSVGARAQVRPSTPLGPLSFTGTVRFGVADRHVNGRLDIAHETLDRRIVVSGYHELAAIEERARHFGVANSLTALLFGRDDGDYYRRSGGMIEWTPPTASPRTFRVRAFAEYHEEVDEETDFQLPRAWDDDASFRPNVPAEEGWDVGLGVELLLELIESDDRTRAGADLGITYLRTPDYWRGALEYAGRVPLSRRTRVLYELEYGTTGGAVPPQRRWYLGGPLSLRGYAPRTLGGEGGFLRGRVELDRAFSFGRVVLFSDAGWSGDHDDMDLDDALYSAGAGLAVIDGILRIDGAWQLESPHDFRLDIYLDQIP